MIKVILSGYGKMGHMVEQELIKRGIELVEASEDIRSTNPDITKQCVGIDFTTPDAFRANYRFLAENFKAVYDQLNRVKPAAVKGTYMKNITVATTMGPGVKVVVE